MVRIFLLCSSKTTLYGFAIVAASPELCHIVSISYIQRMYSTVLLIFDADHQSDLQGLKTIAVRVAIRLPEQFQQNLWRPCQSNKLLAFCPYRRDKIVGARA